MEIISEKKKKVVTVTNTIYKAFDGKTFLLERECLAYEISKTFPYEVVLIERNSEEVKKIQEITDGEDYSSAVWINLPKDFDKKILIGYLESSGIGIRDYNLSKDMQGWYLFTIDWSDPSGPTSVVSYSKIKELLEEEISMLNKTKDYLDNLKFG